MSRYAAGGPFINYGHTTFGTGTLTWQDPVHSWKAGPGEVMTVENLFIYSKSEGMTQFNICHTLVENLLKSRDPTVN